MQKSRLCRTKSEGETERVNQSHVKLTCFRLLDKLSKEIHSSERESFFLFPSLLKSSLGGEGLWRRRRGKSYTIVELKIFPDSQLVGVFYYPSLPFLPVLELLIMQMLSQRVYSTSSHNAPGGYHTTKGSPGEIILASPMASNKELVKILKPHLSFHFCDQVKDRSI